MFVPGRLFFFDPFYFKRGGSSPKFFLVIKVVDGKVILASLPSSQIYLPADQRIAHGCLEVPDSDINCYIFEAQRPVTRRGWCFDRNTFLYGMWLDDFDITILEANHTIEGVDYEIIGDLTEEELKNVVDCFRASSSVKRKYKRWLIL